MPRLEPIGQVWRRASQRVDRLDARLLLEYVSGLRHTDLIAYPESELSEEQSAQFEALLVRRESAEPLAYLVGSAFFYGVEFSVTASVLIPRPDTEVLVDLASARAKVCAMPHIVDLGTGSGCVAVLLARLCPAATVTAVDVCAAALAVARANAKRHGVCVRFFEGDWYAPLGEERFELIVSNPPYIVAGDTHLQHNGLPFEPPSALSDGIAGGDGLACIRTIITGAREHLLPDGWLLIEHGHDQAVKVRELLHLAGFAEVASWCDTADIERVSGGRRVAV